VSHPNEYVGEVLTDEQLQRLNNQLDELRLSRTPQEWRSDVYFYLVNQVQLAGRMGDFVHMSELEDTLAFLITTWRVCAICNHCRTVSCRPEQEECACH
jgi:hypothetical protein